MRVLLLSLLLQATTQAALLKHEVTSAKRVHYSYRKVCQVMGHRHLLIVEPKNTYQLDCMGSIVDVFDFCKKQFPGDPELTRGFINSKMQEVTCERGTSVVVGIGCDKRDKSYCIRPKEGCQRLGKIFAHALTLSHHSFLEKDIDDTLNCFFVSESALEVSLDEPSSLKN